MPSEAKKQKSNHERRQHSRQETWFNTSFQLNNQHWCSGFARDISASGMRILTLEPLLPGTKTAIVLENMAEEENVLVSGTVVWQIKGPPGSGNKWKAPAMGIKFDQMLPVATEVFIH